MSKQALSLPQFVVCALPAVLWPVTVRIPTDGGFADFRFNARIRVYSEEEYLEIMPKAPTDEAGKPIEQPLADVLAINARELPRHIVGWEGVLDERGNAVPIEALPEQLKGPYGRPLSVALWRAISEVRYGIDPSGGATLGNSGSAPAAGSGSAETAAQTS